MKIVLNDFTTEADKLTVSAAQERPLRARRKTAGWDVRVRHERADGQVELTFVRLKLGAAEVTP